MPHTFIRSSPAVRKPGSGLERPGAFQCTLLRAFELPKAYRDVFLLKEIQGHTLAEIAAILGISIDTALVRLKRARREIGHWDDSDAMERGEMNALANSLRRIWSAKNRVPHLTGWGNSGRSKACGRRNNVDLPGAESFFST